MSDSEKVDLGIVSKLTKAVILLIVAAIVVGVGIWYLPLINQNERMRQELHRLATEVKREEDLARQTKSAMDALRNDPRTVERLAREKLGYAKPGETVIRFQNPPTAP